MLRIVVGCTVGAFALVTMACSTTTEPGATPRGVARQQVSGTPIPIAPGVSVTQIPALDDSTLAPMAFNDLGEVTGDSGNPILTVFRWSPARGVRALRAGGGALATGIDDQGRVSLTLGAHAAIWGPDGALTVDSGLAPNEHCFSSAINGKGFVAGMCDSATVIWTPGGAPHTVHTQNGAQLFRDVAAMSNTGYIVGSGYELSPDGRLTLLPQPRTSPAPLAVNDFGVAGGMFFDSTLFGFGPSVWPNPHTIIALAMGAGGVTNGVADDGNAVGAVVDTVRVAVVPFIWNSHDGLRRLPGLGPDSSGLNEQGRAIAINNRRQILGFLTLANGATRWVIWSY